MGNIYHNFFYNHLINITSRRVPSKIVISTKNGDFDRKNLYNNGYMYTLLIDGGYKPVKKSEGDPCGSRETY